MNLKQYLNQSSDGDITAIGNEMFPNQEVEGVNNGHHFWISILDDKGAGIMRLGVFGDGEVEVYGSNAGFSLPRFNEAMKKRGVNFE